ncbi:hypothetical protein AB2L27_00250 [Kineococcus sp. LSe6-4]|uniref:Uncharacterized protein n=1 Tax=Kineococcus halophytocola TaxID=3234027 RepID=A0ABV4GY98_9ACTN
MPADGSGKGRHSLPDRWRSTWPWLVVLPLAVAVPVLLKAALEGKGPTAYEGSDWSNLLTAVLLATAFLVLGNLVDRGSQRRARAAADAGLLRAVGSMNTTRARAFANTEPSVLRLSAEARAALQHYPFASPEEQDELIETIRRSWNDLVFGNLCRADALSNSVWELLDAGGKALSSLSTELAGRVRGRKQQADLQDLADHVNFARQVGADIRQVSWSSRAGADTRLDESSKLLTVRRLEQLYADELRVIKRWNALSDKIVACDVELRSLTSALGWHAPWYVTVDGPVVKPVNAKCEELREAARGDSIVGGESLPTYPQPLRHGALPLGLRPDGIAQMTPLLSGPQATVCVLLYELKKDGRRETLVLDGNHRLAAAVRGLQDGTAKAPVRVLAFRIRENKQVDAAGCSESRTGESWEYSGFTPDIALLRNGRLLPE